jgi:hypothetical protein
MSKSMEVVINGVRYAPVDPIADSIRFYYMHDNHTFTRLKGKTLEKILRHADEIEAGEGGSYGALCPAILMCGDKEVRRVGKMAHAKGSKDPKDEWEKGKAKWLKEVEADADVRRLLWSK